MNTQEISTFFLTVLQCVYARQKPYSFNKLLKSTVLGYSALGGLRVSGRGLGKGEWGRGVSFLEKFFFIYIKLCYYTYCFSSFKTLPIIFLLPV